MGGIGISGRELRRGAGREAGVGVLRVVDCVCAAVQVVVYEFAAFFEGVGLFGGVLLFWFLLFSFFGGGGGVVEVREDERGGFGQFELGVGFAGREFEVVFQPGAEGVGVEGFGDVVRDVRRGGRPAVPRRLVGHQHGVEAAGLEEVGVYFVEEVVGSMGSLGQYTIPYRTALMLAF